MCQRRIGGRPASFVRDSTLFVQPFDPERLEFAGDAVPLAGGIGTSYANAHFSASTNGRLVYRTADANSVQLTWFDRQGRPVAEVGEPVSPSAPGFRRTGGASRARKSRSSIRADVDGLAARHEITAGRP